MKYGEYLISQIHPEWEPYYINYEKLKEIIKYLEKKYQTDETISDGKNDKSPVSKSTTPKDQNTYTSEEFHQLLQSEMKKIEKFTTEQVNIIRKSLSEISSRIDSALLRFTYKRKFDNSFELEEDNDINDLKKELEVIGQNFLQLEKFVNLNYMGFHKILKKNDRRLPPQFSCKAFYLARLHEQSWIRGDNSDIMVTMSRLYSLLRGETLNLPSKNNSSSEKTAAAKAAAENEQQNFVRSTKKYWVHMENISKVKYMVLQNLPVFLQKTMAGETDSQLINSVYLDNFSMELYHGRLEKTPGAIALRFRWYGDKTPEEDPSVVVFVERKTHRESWAGDVSVKERFIISESQVIPLLKGKFDQETEIKKMEKKGKSEKEINEWKQLVNEVVQAINSKQLLPTMRTQYMRTAFQIPFDASVRISLDTNLCMILDRTKETLQGLRWFRSSSTAIPPTQITRFPHAVLEIKLQLEDESKTPLWVNELIHSGMLLEVHKFSKFIHGCAVLLPEDVRAMPYWIDDVTLADSIHSSGAGRILEKSVGANQEYRELLPHDQEGNVKIRPAQLNYLDYQKEKEEGKIKVRESPFIGYELCREYCDNQYCDWAFSADAERMTIQKAEPKLFFANERTFLTWLQMAVNLGGVATALLAFDPISPNKLTPGTITALCLLPISLIFIFYAIRVFFFRSDQIRDRSIHRWDDPIGPVILCTIFVIAILIQFFLKLREFTGN